jgi:hypothetical protein
VSQNNKCQQKPVGLRGTKQLPRHVPGKCSKHGRQSCYLLLWSHWPSAMWQHRTQGISNVLCCNVGETTVLGPICDSTVPTSHSLPGWAETGRAVFRVAYMHGTPATDRLSRVSSTWVTVLRKTRLQVAHSVTQCRHHGDVRYLQYRFTTRKCTLFAHKSSTTSLCPFRWHNHPINVVNEIWALLGFYAAYICSFFADVSGQSISPILKGPAWPLKMWRIDCPETSATNYTAVF